MRVIREDEIVRKSFNESSFKMKLKVYSLPYEGETYNEEYADIAWGLYRKHCVKCPYKISERSTQFKKV